MGTEERITGDVKVDMSADEFEQASGKRGVFIGRIAAGLCAKEVPLLWIHRQTATIAFFGFRPGAHTVDCALPDGGRLRDSSLSRLARFHGELLEVSSMSAGVLVMTTNAGLVCLRSRMPEKLANKLRKLDLAYKVPRHLSSSYLSTGGRGLRGHGAAQRL